MPEARTDHVYQGMRDGLRSTRVLVDDEPLPMTELAQRKSPSGFDWGYGGSGPAALAHSILVYEFGEDAARFSYQDFKWVVVAELDHTSWTLTSARIRQAVQPRTQPMHDPTC